jgi:conjugal transfer pilus assembly protein TraE
LLRSRFVEYWNDLQYQNRLLVVGITALSFAVAALGLSFWRFVSWQKVILVPPRIDTRVEVAGNSTNREYLQLMTEFLSQQIMEYTPVDIERRIDTILFYVPARLYPDVKKKLDDMRRTVQGGNLSQVFRIDKAALEGGEMEVQGHIVRYVGQHAVWDHNAVLRMSYEVRDGRLYLLGFKVEVKKDSGFNVQELKK